jgi:hypothetical protein
MVSYGSKNDSQRTRTVTVARTVLSTRRFVNKRLRCAIPLSCDCFMIKATSRIRLRHSLSVYVASLAMYLGRISADFVSRGDGSSRQINPEFRSPLGSSTIRPMYFLCAKSMRTALSVAASNQNTLPSFCAWGRSGA